MYKPHRASPVYRHFHKNLYNSKPFINIKLVSEKAQNLMCSLKNNKAIGIIEKVRVMYQSRSLTTV